MSIDNKIELIIKNIENNYLNLKNKNKENENSIKSILNDFSTNFEEFKFKFDNNIIVKNSISNLNHDLKNKKNLIEIYSNNLSDFRLKLMNIINNIFEDYLNISKDKSILILENNLLEQKNIYFEDKLKDLKFNNFEINNEEFLKIREESFRLFDQIINQSQGNINDNLKLLNENKISKYEKIYKNDIFSNNVKLSEKLIGNLIETNSSINIDINNKNDEIIKLKLEIENLKKYKVIFSENYNKIDVKNNFTLVNGLFEEIENLKNSLKEKDIIINKFKNEWKIKNDIQIGQKILDNLRKENSIYLNCLSFIKEKIKKLEEFEDYDKISHYLNKKIILKNRNNILQGESEIIEKIEDLYDTKIILEKKYLKLLNEFKEYKILNENRNNPVRNDNLIEQITNTYDNKINDILEKNKILYEENINSKNLVMALNIRLESLVFEVNKKSDFINYLENELKENLKNNKNFIINEVKNYYNLVIKYLNNSINFLVKNQKDLINYFNNFIDNFFKNNNMEKNENNWNIIFNEIKNKFKYLVTKFNENNDNINNNFEKYSSFLKNKINNEVKINNQYKDLNSNLRKLNDEYVHKIKNINSNFEKLDINHLIQEINLLITKENNNISEVNENINNKSEEVFSQIDEKFNFLDNLINTDNEKYQNINIKIEDLKVNYINIIKKQENDIIDLKNQIKLAKENKDYEKLEKKFLKFKTILEDMANIANLKYDNSNVYDIVTNLDSEFLEKLINIFKNYSLNYDLNSLNIFDSMLKFLNDNYNLLLDKNLDNSNKNNLIDKTKEILINYNSILKISKNQEILTDENKNDNEMLEKEENTLNNQEINLEKAVQNNNEMILENEEQSIENENKMVLDGNKDNIKDQECEIIENNGKENEDKILEEENEILKKEDNEDKILEEEEEDNENKILEEKEIEEEEEEDNEDKILEEEEEEDNENKILEEEDNEDKILEEEEDNEVNEDKFLEEEEEKEEDNEDNEDTILEQEEENVNKILEDEENINEILEEENVNEILKEENINDILKEENINDILEEENQEEEQVKNPNNINISNIKEKQNNEKINNCNSSNKTIQDNDKNAIKSIEKEKSQQDEEDSNKNTKTDLNCNQISQHKLESIENDDNKQKSDNKNSEFESNDDLLNLYDFN